MVKERNKNGGDTKERIIPKHHAGGKIKTGSILSMLPSGHRNLGKEKTGMSKGMTASLDLVQISNTYIV